MGAADRGSNRKSLLRLSLSVALKSACVLFALALIAAVLTLFSALFSDRHGQAERFVREAIENQAQGKAHPAGTVSASAESMLRQIADTLKEGPPQVTLAESIVGEGIYYVEVTPARGTAVMFEVRVKGGVMLLSSHD